MNAKDQNTMSIDAKRLFPMMHDKRIRAFVDTHVKATLRKIEDAHDVNAESPSPSDEAENFMGEFSEKVIPLLSDAEAKQALSEAVALAYLSTTAEVGSQREQAAFCKRKLEEITVAVQASLVKVTDGIGAVTIKPGETEDKEGGE